MRKTRANTRYVNVILSDQVADALRRAAFESTEAGERLSQGQIVESALLQVPAIAAHLRQTRRKPRKT